MTAGWRSAAHAAHRAWWRVRKPRTLGVKVMLVDERSERVVLVRHWYRPGLLLLGGGVRRRESFRHAARREMHEELGVTIARPPR